MSKDVNFGNYTIPSETIVSTHIFTIHRNPHIWKNPSIYDPIRFHPDNAAKRGPYNYIPFSAGSRNCIGQNFAMNEMKVVIATVVNQFSLKVDESHLVKLVPRIVLCTESDIKLFMHRL